MNCKEPDVLTSTYLRIEFRPISATVAKPHDPKSDLSAHAMSKGRTTRARLKTRQNPEHLLPTIEISIRWVFRPMARRQHDQYSGHFSRRSFCLLALFAILRFSTSNVSRIAAVNISEAGIPKE